MATNFDRALAQAPEGDQLPLEGEGFEIEVEIEGEGGLDELIQIAGFADVPFDANLAEFIDDDKLANIASDLVAEVENDLLSRKDWEEAIVDGIKFLGIKPEARSEPWEGASNVVHPLITEAVVRFQSEAITETFPAAGPVKVNIIGEATHQKEQAARRVRADMNYQLTEVMTEYRGEHERMLWSLPIVGSAFKKVYYDPSLGRQVSMFVPAEDVVLPYGVSDVSLTPRLTHRMRKTKNEILRLQAQGFYASVELPDPVGERPSEVRQAQDDETGFSANFDNRHLLYEIHCELDLPGFEHKDAEGEPTGIACPYVVTIDSQSSTVLSIRRNWIDGDERYIKRQHFVHYQYVPGFGAYGLGLLHLIGNNAKAATSIQRQLIDAGTLSNLPGGLKSRGLRIAGDDTPIAPGEFRDVDVGSGNIRDNIMTLPYKEPSQTLLAMMGVITSDAQRLASTADMKISDMSAQAPVGTTLAIIERSLKILSAVQARLHFSLKQELKLLAAIIRDYADEDYDYDAEGDADNRPHARTEDFSHVDIIPVSDPNASTLAQRVVQYQAVMQLAQAAPQIYNLPRLHRQMLEVLGIKEAEKLVELEEDRHPEDPITENMNILNGKPVKAYLYQDHEAHITVHMAAMQDPQLMQLLGQNPNAQAMLAAAHAHITEHVAFAYRRKIEEQVGASLPPVSADLPPDVEVQLSQVAAQAAGKLLGKHQAEAQAEANARASQDPVLQMQQRELALKEGELEVKKQRLAIDGATAADTLRLKQELEAARLELEAFKAGHKAALERARLESEQEMHGLDVGVDVAKTQAQLDASMQQAGARLGAEVAKTAIQAEAAAKAVDDELPEQPQLGGQ